MKRARPSQKPPSRTQRKRKVAERVRHVDISVVHAAQQRRLDMLEDDNYAAEAEAAALADEPEYDPDAQSDEDLIPSTKKKAKRGRSSRAVSAGKAKAKRGIERWNKPLQQALDEEDWGRRPANMANYYDIAARPSGRPARRFCSVCGHKAAYTCTRCFVRFCCVGCGKVHEETRCLKYTS